MNHLQIVRYVLRAAAMFTLVIGASLLVASNVITDLFNGENSTNEHFAVYLGTALIGFSVANWMYSRLDDLKSIRPAIYGNLASLIPASIVDLVLVAQGHGSLMIWLVLLMHLVFAVAFSYSLAIINNDLDDHR